MNIKEGILWLLTYCFSLQNTDPEPVFYQSLQHIQPKPVVLQAPQSTEPEPVVVPEPQPTEPEPVLSPMLQSTETEPVLSPMAQSTESESVCPETDELHGNELNTFVFIDPQSDVLVDQTPKISLFSKLQKHVSHGTTKFQKMAISFYLEATLHLHMGTKLDLSVDDFEGDIEDDIRAYLKTKSYSI